MRNGDGVWGCVQLRIVREAIGRQADLTHLETWQLRSAGSQRRKKRHKDTPQEDISRKHVTHQCTSGSTSSSVQDAVEQIYGAQSH